MPSRSQRNSWLDTPEINIVIFAFLLNYPWEFLQVPFFGGMPANLHWEGVRTCTQAALGDVVFTLAAFWIAAAYMRSRYWVLAPRGSALVIFVGTGVAITTFVEWLSTRILDRWTYAEIMPIVPLLQVGLLPLLQWLLLPPLVAWFVKRQLS